MIDSLDISEVVRRTGVTARALRFYEARGLVSPLRTASGRRHYGPLELERLHQIILLKRAGLTLAQIQRLSGRRPINLSELIAAQLETLAAQAQEIAEAQTLLRSVQSRIDRSEPIDVATFCSLIRHGETSMETQKWEKVTARYFNEEERAIYQERMNLLSKDFDRSEYAAKWKALGGRIKADLPMDPASPAAQAYLDEWDALLQPFLSVATPGMIKGAERFYSRMEEWEGEADPGFDAETFQFIMAASKVRKDIQTRA